MSIDQLLASTQATLYADYMRKLRFSKEFRNRLSEKLIELGNLIGIALAAGQFIAEKKFSPEAFIAGLILMLLCYIISYIVSP